MRGLQGQYALAARVIYSAMANGELAWIGVADRRAGIFDDVVIGYADGTVRGHQVKSSRDPDTFSMETLLLGAERLLARMIESLGTLEADHPDEYVEIVYVCDDLPRSTDQLVRGDPATSSAAFLRLHREQRQAFGLIDWKATPFGAFIEDLLAASGLAPVRFEAVLQRIRFVAGPERRSEGHPGDGPGDPQRLAALAGLLPQLVADPSDRDRWPFSELMRRLGWNDPFTLRHMHSFPLGEFVQPNHETEGALQAALDRQTRGYVSLVGPPGSGKSTLLESGLLPTSRALIARYLAYVPTEAQGLGRAEAYDFLHDIVGQLKAAGLGRRIVQSTALGELRAQFGELLTEASQRYRTDGVRTIIVVDGLDHVPREDRTPHPFLKEFPEPEAVPEGVVFLLGSQRVDLEGLPKSVRDAAKAAEIQIAPLSREAVSRWADEAVVPQDVDRAAIWDKSQGHPLSTRYGIEALRLAPDEAARRAWLALGPSYDGDVEAFYRRAWHDLEATPAAQRALGYLALSEGHLRPASLDRLVGAEVTDLAWAAAKHLLVRDARGGWAVFHNSFRLFLAAQTGVRHGLPDEAVRQARYRQLATLAAEAPADDPQRWLELRYRARAGDAQAVLALASQTRFRWQLIEGRGPAALKEDIRLGFRAAGEHQDPVALVRLVLAYLEVAQRSDALGDEVLDLLIALEDHSAALALQAADDTALSRTAGFRLVDALLARGEGLAARKLFAELEPLDLLHGRLSADDPNGEAMLEPWAYRALAFRTPDKVLAGIQRLRPPETHRAQHFDLRGLRQSLKLVAVLGELTRRPQLDIDVLCEAMDVPAGLRPHAVRAAALGSGNGDASLTKTLLRRAAAAADRLLDWERRALAGLALELGDPVSAEVFLRSLPAPCLDDFQQTFSDAEMREGVAEVFRYAQARAEAGLPAEAGRTSKSTLLTACQRHLEALGRLSGDARRRRLEPEALPGLSRAVLDTLQVGLSEREVDTDRRQLDRVMDDVVACLVQVLGEHGDDALRRFLSTHAARFETGRLSQASVRRRLAVSIFRVDGDVDAATQALDAIPASVEQTPGLQLMDLAEQATAWLSIGATDRAQAVVATLHDHSLGYARPAKKDPQYILWRELLEHACRADPTRRPERLGFMARLLHGMAQTEGSSAARRVVAWFIGEAVRLGPQATAQACELVDDRGLVTWSDLVAFVARAVAEHDADAAPVAALVYARAGLPWTDQHDSPPLAGFIAAAAENDVAALGASLMSALAMDGQTTQREKLEGEVAAALAARGVHVPPGSPAGGAPAAGAPADPFAGADSPQEILARLEGFEGDRDISLPRAFLRVAPGSTFEALADLFRADDCLGDDTRCIAALADAAHRAGRADDVERYLAALSAKSDRGGWTEWGGSTSIFQHRLRIEMQGEPARRLAFKALCDDLADAREWPEAVRHHLCDLVELTCPSPDWAAMWEELAEQLRPFREFELGTSQPFAAGTQDAASSAEILAELLARGAAVGATELTGDVRRVADELVSGALGPAIVGRLARKLLVAGGDLRLEGAQIAWTHAHLSEVSGAIADLLRGLQADEDYAVRVRADGIASILGQSVTPFRVALPAGYRILMPDQGAADFSLPSGHSPTSQGLWTDDPRAWTWALERPLATLDKACPIELPILRARIGAKMREAGGRDAFGPEADRAVSMRFNRLSLETGFTKLMAVHAFAATRKVVGELMAAEAMTPGYAPWVLLDTAAPPLLPLTLDWQPRPAGVEAPVFPARFGSEDEAWLGDVEARPVILPGRHVLAATTWFRQRSFEDNWIIERYLGPAPEGEADALAEVLIGLPSLIRFSGDTATGPRSPSLVAAVRPSPAHATPTYTVALSARVAQDLGWRWDRRRAFRLLDEAGALMAETLFWREGGHQGLRAHDGYVGEGSVLVLSDAGLEALVPLLTGKMVCLGWRHVHRRAGKSAAAQFSDLPWPSAVTPAG